MSKPQAPRVGLMTPINNTTFEVELLQGLPEGAQCMTLRIPRGAGLLTQETLPAYMDSALALARQFRDSDVEVVAYGCTAAGFISGPVADTRLSKQLAEITGKPVITTARAMVVALQEIGAKDIALVTPYMDAVNDQLKAFLLDGGIRVRSFNSFYAETVDKLGRITSSEVAQLARETMTDQCDAMFIACAQLPTIDILEPLRAEFNRPVLSSIQSTTQAALRLLERQPA